MLGKRQRRPFELLAPDAEWTSVGTSPLSKTYRSKQELLDKRIGFEGLDGDNDMDLFFFEAEVTPSP